MENIFRKRIKKEKRENKKKLYPVLKHNDVVLLLLLFFVRLFFALCCKHHMVFSIECHKWISSKPQLCFWMYAAILKNMFKMSLNMRNFVKHEVFRCFYFCNSYRITCQDSLCTYVITPGLNSPCAFWSRFGNLPFKESIPYVHQHRVCFLNHDDNIYIKWTISLKEELWLGNNRLYCFQFIYLSLQYITTFDRILFHIRKV